MRHAQHQPAPIAVFVITSSAPRGPSGCWPLVGFVSSGLLNAYPTVGAAAFGQVSDNRSLSSSVYQQLTALSLSSNTSWMLKDFVLLSPIEYFSPSVLSPKTSHLIAFMWVGTCRTAYVFDCPESAMKMRILPTSCTPSSRTSLSQHSKVSCQGQSSEHQVILWCF